MSTRWATAAVAVSAAFLIVCAPGRATEPPPGRAVELCIERNGARYATPDKAWITQYISLGDACRARFGKEGDVTANVTPLATGVIPTGPTRTAVAQTTRSSNPPVHDRGGKKKKAPTSHAASKPRRGGKTYATQGRSASVAPMVRAALAQGQARESVISGGFAPGWLVALLLVPPLAAAAVRSVRRR
jgi:hypothetical protein